MGVYILFSRANEAFGPTPAEMTSERMILIVTRLTLLEVQFETEHHAESHDPITPVTTARERSPSFPTQA
jgi:hypothetical protein